MSACVLQPINLTLWHFVSVGMSITGLTAPTLRSPLNALRPSTSTTWWPGCRISWMMKHFSPRRLVSCHQAYTLHTHIIFSLNIYIPKGPQLFSHAEPANCWTVKQDRDPKDSWQAVILFPVTWFHLKRSCVSHEDGADCTLCYHVGFKERRFKGGRGCSSLWRSHFLTLCHTGVPFPKNFMSVAKTILKRLFRVYAHIYHQHFDSVMQLQEEAHLNTSFKHFIFFVQVRSMWDLITDVYLKSSLLCGLMIRDFVFIYLMDLFSNWKPWEAKTLGRVFLPCVLCEMLHNVTYT